MIRKRGHSAANPACFLRFCWKLGSVGGRIPFADPRGHSSLAACFNCFSFALGKRPKKDGTGKGRLLGIAFRVVALGRSPVFPSNNESFRALSVWVVAAKSRVLGNLSRLQMLDRIFARQTSKSPELGNQGDPIRGRIV